MHQTIHFIYLLTNVQLENDLNHLNRIINYGKGNAELEQLLGSLVRPHRLCPFRDGFNWSNRPTPSQLVVNINN